MDYIFQLLDDHLDDTYKRDQERKKFEEQQRRKRVQVVQSQPPVVEKPIVQEAVVQQVEDSVVEVKDSVVNAVQEVKETVEETVQDVKETVIDIVEEDEKVVEEDEKVVKEIVKEDEKVVKEIVKEDDTDKYIDVIVNDIIDNLVNQFDKMVNEDREDREDREDADSDLEHNACLVELQNTKDAMVQAELKHTQKYNQLYTDYMVLYEEYFATKEKIADYQLEIMALQANSNASAERVKELEDAIVNLMGFANDFSRELKSLHNL